MTDIRVIPVSDILADAMLRDRATVAPEALQELKLSILKSGLRQPVEVFALAEGGEHAWGLISGFRRLTAFRSLAADGMKRFADIPAFVRTPGSVARAMTEMVEENAIRAEVSAWELAQLAVTACGNGLFETVDAAVEHLYASLHRDRRRRLRGIAHLVEELEDLLVAPETHSQQRLLRLAAAVTRGFGDVLRHALGELRHPDPEVQWRHLLPILAEAEDRALPEPRTAPDGRPRPRRILEVSQPALRIRRERTPTGWCLHFTGRAATDALLDTVFDHLESTFTPG